MTNREELQQAIQQGTPYKALSAECRREFSEATYNRLAEPRNTSQTPLAIKCQSYGCNNRRKFGRGFCEEHYLIGQIRRHEPGCAYEMLGSPTRCNCPTFNGYPGVTRPEGAQRPDSLPWPHEATPDVSIRRLSDEAYETMLEEIGKGFESYSTETVRRIVWDFEKQYAPPARELVHTHHCPTCGIDWQHRCGNPCTWPDACTCDNCDYDADHAPAPAEPRGTQARDAAIDAAILDIPAPCFNCVEVARYIRARFVGTGFSQREIDSALLRLRTKGKLTMRGANWCKANFGA